MSASLTWLDHDSSERDRMNRILALFRERDTRDELGVGVIRDLIADEFFPGTSTIQTRLRYMLFVPPFVFLEIVNLAGMKGFIEFPILEVKICFPRRRNPDWITSHDGIQKPEGLFLGPHEIPLNCG
jgi:hypothetical protein